MKTSKQIIKFVSPFPTLAERFVVGWMQVKHRAAAVPLLFDKEDPQFHEAVRIGVVEVVEGRDAIDLHCEPIINPYPPMRRICW